MCENSTHLKSLMSVISEQKPYTDSKTLLL